ncbi:MAG: hypothetical protein ACLSW7_01325 [Acutalibacteraceae bacterium]
MEKLFAGYVNENRRAIQILAANHLNNGTGDTYVFAVGGSEL